MQEIVKNNKANEKIEIVKKQTGITLIALVITIIVLLILAGVSIAMLSGNNGILTQAKLVKQETSDSAQKEKEDLIKLEMLANNSKVNIPNLKEGMIPVKWNATNKTWEVADKSNTGNDWYDYSTESRKWANVVTVKEKCSNGKTRADYLSAGVGTAISEDDITTIFVWIPRYSYYVKSGYHTNANGTGEFAIKFLLGKSDKIIDAPKGQDTAIRLSETNKEKYGDAIWETSNGCNGQSSWNLDYSYFPYIDNMFFLHGGNYNGSTGAGVFYFYGSGGCGYGDYSFRVVLF